MKKLISLTRIIEVEIDDDLIDEVILTYALMTQSDTVTIDEVMLHVAESHQIGFSVVDRYPFLKNYVTSTLKGMESSEIQPKSTESEGI